MKMSLLIRGITRRLFWPRLNNHRRTFATFLNRNNLAAVAGLINQLKNNRWFTTIVVARNGPHTKSYKGFEVSLSNGASHMFVKRTEPGERGYEASTKFASDTLWPLLRETSRY
jgi:hypothetical protein